jgi:hypothetical protein
MMNFNADLQWLIPFLVLELIFKGIALWKASKNNQKYWFVGLLMLNTAGLVPLLYLKFFQKTFK